MKNFLIQHVLNDQCTPINNSSTLPTFEYKINSNIENISLSEHEICLLFVP